MNSISNEKIRRIRFLRNNGFSYKQIAKLVGVANGTSLKYAKQIFLAPSLKEQLVQNENKNRRKFVNLYAKAKDISRPELDEKLASVLGHLFFDGNVSKFNGKYILQYTNASGTAINHFIKNVNALFSIKPAKMQKFKNKSTWFQAYFYSKRAVEFVEKYSKTFSTKFQVGVPDAIMFASDNIKSAFLRAFWDDEGSISKRGYICGCSKSEPMINDLLVMHKDLGIDCTKQIDRRSNCYIIYIPKYASNIVNFSKKAGFEYGLITKGANASRLKKDVLNDLIEQRSAFNSL